METFAGIKHYEDTRVIAFFADVVAEPAQTVLDSCRIVMKLERLLGVSNLVIEDPDRIHGAYFS